MGEDRLTTPEIEEFLPNYKAYKKADGRGMHLVVSTSGRKWWRYDYQWAGKRRSISFGSFSAIDLNNARQQRKVCEGLIARDVDPAIHRKRWLTETDRIDSFDLVTKEWLTFRSRTMSDQLKAKTATRLKNDILPVLGSMPIKKISETIILKLIKEIEAKRQIDKAHRTRQTIQKIFEYALEAGIIRHNPTINLRNSQRSLATRHYKYIERSKDVAHLMHGISAYHGYSKTRLALEFAALVFVRPTQLIHAKWSAINLEEKEWHIELNGTRHVVPLATQTLKILMHAKPPSNREGFIFHTRKSRHLTLSANTLNHALKKITENITEITVWGFRRMAQKHLSEMGWSQMALKKQLQGDCGYESILQKDISYTDKDLLLERKSMMQAWADYLEMLKDGGNRVSMYGAIRVKKHTN